MSRRILVGLLAGLAVVAMWASVGSPRADFGTGIKNPDSLTLARECEYGVTMALSGDTLRAESAFVSLLSHSPRDASALNNLGNLRFQGGDAEIALIYYLQASRSDSADAGIHLNRSIASWYVGRDDEARRERDLAVELAGGEEPALELLGLLPESDADEELGSRVPQADSLAPGRGPRGVRISQRELRRFLSAAAKRVPRAAPSPKVEGALPARPARIHSRPAGSRGADELEVGVALYWKQFTALAGWPAKPGGK